MPGQVCRSVLHLTDWVLFLHVSLLYWDLWNLFISSLLFVSNVHCCSLLFSEHHCLGSHMSDGSQQICKNTSYIDFCPFGAQLNVSLYIYKYFIWCTYSYMSGLQCLFWACIQLNFNLSLTISEPFWFRTFCAAHAHFCLLPGPQWVWPSAVSQFSILMCWCRRIRMNMGSYFVSVITSIIEVLSLWGT